MIGFGVKMFGMGMTLSKSSISNALVHPHWIGLGICSQFLIMPLVAFVLVFIMDLPLLYASGVILVGACPGGTASNVIAFPAIVFSVWHNISGPLLATIWRTSNRGKQYSGH